jgi:hypothetical protein
MPGEGRRGGWEYGRGEGRGRDSLIFCAAARGVCFDAVPINTLAQAKSAFCRG